MPPPLVPRCGPSHPPEHVVLQDLRYARLSLTSGGRLELPGTRRRVDAVRCRRELSRGGRQQWMRGSCTRWPEEMGRARDSSNAASDHAPAVHGPHLLGPCGFGLGRGRAEREKLTMGPKSRKGSASQRAVVALALRWRCDPPQPAGEDEGARRPLGRTGRELIAASLSHSVSLKRICGRSQDGA